MLKTTVLLFAGTLPAHLLQSFARGAVPGLDLSNNTLYGTIPATWGSAYPNTTFEVLNLSRNALSGTISEILGPLLLAGSSDVSYNGLSGQVPASWNSSSPTYRYGH